MDYEFFYDLAEYVNKANKNNLTPKEIAKAAFEYFFEYRDSIVRHKVNRDFKVVINTLKANKNDEEAKEFLDEIECEFSMWKVKREV